MNNENLFAFLRSLREQDVICYAYRETAFYVLSTGKVDSTLHFITDSDADDVCKALTAKGCKDATVNGETVDARLGNQSIKVKLVSDDEEKLIKTFTQPLTINSLLLRDSDDVRDRFNGTQDIDEKILRRTDAPIQDKSSFCSMCFELTLKRGFTADKSVKDEMKKMVTLPMPKKVSFLFSIRSVIKSSHFNIGYLLNTLEYDGLFSNVGEISRNKKRQLDTALRKTEPDTLILFLCYLAGFKGDQLRYINNLSFPKESYDKIFKFFKDGCDTEGIRSAFAGDELPVATSFAELLALLSGKEFTMSKPKSNLFRKLDADGLWKKYTGVRSQTDTKQKEESAMAEKEEQPISEEMPDVFGGPLEENYVPEDPEDEEVQPETPGYGVRNPTNNVFISKNPK